MAGETEALDCQQLSESEEKSFLSETQTKQKKELPKRKVGLLLAFCGKHYYGLQLNRGNTTLPTIEGALFKALVDAQLVPEICLENSQQMKYSSSSRTDKGVSTCGLVVSLKLRMSDKTVSLLNDHLPADIRVLDMKRATRSFHAKNNADGRTYSYTMPTFPFESDASDLETYRISKEKLEHVNLILQKYKGTHSFHNFTSGKRMGEASAKRYIMNFWTEAPFIHKSVEFITLKVKGQSFMIHQIRKMIGLLIVLVSGKATQDHFDRSFSEPLEDVPKAPGTGLILEQVHYENYNKKHGHIHGGMDWSSSADKAKEFLQTHILPVVYEEEIKNGSMQDWIEGLSNHDFTGVKAKEQWNLQMLEKKEKEARRNEVQHKDSNDINGEKSLPKRSYQDNPNLKAVCESDISHHQEKKPKLDVI